MRQGLACLLVLAAAGAASAQFPPSPYGGRPPGYPYPRPGLSPYLNLLRGGDPAANYYLGTIPEIQRRQNARQFRTQIQDLERRTAELEPEDDDLGRPLGTTGHPVAFNNTGSYFNTTNPIVPRTQPRPPTKRRGGR